MLVLFICTNLEIETEKNFVCLTHLKITIVNALQSTINNVSLGKVSKFFKIKNI